MNEIGLKKPVTVYKATIESSGFNGSGTVSICDGALRFGSLFQQEALSLADVGELSYQNYAVRVSAKDSLVVFSKMGREADGFFSELNAAYQDKVKTALNLEGQQGDCFKGLVESSEGFRLDSSEIVVFGDCLCILPSSVNARCLPFPFITELNRQGYSLSLTLLSGESYSFSMLGLELEPMERRISLGIQALREKNSQLIEKLGCCLTPSDSVKAAQFFSEGVLAPLSSLPAALKDVLLKKLENSKSSDYLPHFKELGDFDALAIGVKELPEEAVEALKAQLLETLQVGEAPPSELTPQQEDALRWIVVSALPSIDGRKAIVEFSIPNEAAATYVFELRGSFSDFLASLNIALWHTKLERSVFSLPDDKLTGPESEAQRMLVDRSPWVRRLRAEYKGKTAHASVPGWKRSISELLSSTNQACAPTPQCFCTQCGARLNHSPRFCPQCGAKL